MEVFLVYLWLKLDSLITGLCFLIFACCAGAGISAICSLDLYGEKKAYWFKLMRRFLGGALCLLGLVVLVPSSKETAILVGTSYAVDLAKSPEGAKVVSLIRKKANEYLDAELNKGVK